MIFYLNAVYARVARHPDRALSLPYAEWLRCRVCAAAARAREEGEAAERERDRNVFAYAARWGMVPRLHTPHEAARIAVRRRARMARAAAREHACERA